MEEIKRSLATGSSSSIKLEAVTSLYSRILTGPDQEAALKLVWTGLRSEDCLTCQASADLLIVLVRTEKLEIGSTITQLLACLSQGMEYSGLVPALGELIILQAARQIRQTGEFRQSYSISSSQHPLLAVLRSTPATWSLVLDVILSIFRHPEPSIRSNAINILRPVILFLFCDPNHHIHFAAIRAALLESLLQMAEIDESVKNFLLDMMDWLKLDNKASLQESALYIYRVLGLCLLQSDYQTLAGKLYILPSLALNQAKFGYSLYRSVELLDRLVTLSLEEKVVVCWDLVLVMLEQILDICCHSQHSVLLGLASRLMERCLVSRLPAAILVSSLLHSLSFPSQYPSGLERKAELVRKFYKTSWQENPGLADLTAVEVTVADCDVRAALETVRLCRGLSDRDDGEAWLASLTKHPTPHLPSLRPLLAGLLLCSRHTKTAQLCLQLLARSVTARPSSSSPVLALVLHCLADTEASPQLKLSLLHCLPAMAADRACVSLILRLVSSLSSRPSFAPLRLALLYQLWRVEVRVFPYLQAALLETGAGRAGLEWETSQASVIRDVVTSHANQHGSDLLPVLSNILNHCTSPEGSTACKLALQGIKTLCQHSVIDMKTTVKVLSPKVARDSRPAVLTAYIQLLGLAPSFALSGSEYQTFLSETVTWLWQTVSRTEAGPVREASYSALGEFSLEITQLRMLPATARQGVKLPPKYCSTPGEAARSPEDVLPYVPSDCWARLLLSDRESEALVGALVRQEVASLPRAVYSLSQSMQNSGTEPVNYSHLPEHSVLRGLVQTSLESAAARRDLPRHPSQLQSESSALAAVLRLLAADHGRPLPPLDWTFLEQLFVDPVLRPGVIAVLARQASTSRTARVSVERLLREVNLDREAVLEFTFQLHLLVSSVSQQTMSAWLTRTLQKSNPVELTKILRSVARALESEKVGEGGLQVVSQALESLHDKIPVEQEELYQQYLLTVSSLPANTIERLSSPSLWWEVTQDKLNKAAGLRATVALAQETDTPLTWLNEILEVTSRQSGDKTFLLSQLMTVLTKYRAENTKHVIRSWLLELMGQISAVLRSGKVESVSFLLEVFSLAVIVSTETDSLLVSRDLLTSSWEARLDLLPLAVCRLCLHHPNISGQLADWVYQLANNSLAPGEFRRTLRRTSKVFKYSSNWQEATMWGKLVMMKPSQ